MSFETTALILAWLAILLLGLAMSGLLRQVHLLGASHGSRQFAIGPVEGEPAPPLGPRVDWGSGPHILLFVEGDCRSCQRVLPEFHRLSQVYRQLQFISIYSGEGTRRASGTVRLLSGEARTFEDYGVAVTPFAATVDQEGIVRDSEPIGSISDLRQFIARAAETLTVGGETHNGNLAKRHSAI